MKTNKAPKTNKISGPAYVAMQADMASREGAVSAALAHLFFQCACISGERSVEEWDVLVLAAREAGVSIADAIEFADE